MTKLTAHCTCCPGCDHALVTAPLGPGGAEVEVEGQYTPCNACGQTVSGKPADGKPALRMLPGTEPART